MAVKILATPALAGDEVAYQSDIAALEAIQPLHWRWDTPAVGGAEEGFVGEGGTARDVTLTMDTAPASGTVWVQVQHSTDRASWTNLFTSAKGYTTGIHTYTPDAATVPANSFLRAYVTAIPGGTVTERAFGTTATSGTTTTATVPLTVPGSAVNGDTLVAVIQSSKGMASAPSGWTMRGQEEMIHSGTLRSATTILTAPYDTGSPPSTTATLDEAGHFVVAVLPALGLAADLSGATVTTSADGDGSDSGATYLGPTVDVTAGDLVVQAVGCWVGSGSDNNVLTTTPTADTVGGSVRTSTTNTMLAVYVTVAGATGTQAGLSASIDSGGNTNGSWSAVSASLPPADGDAGTGLNVYTRVALA